MDGMGGGAPAAHDHSAHAAHGAGVDRLPGGRYHYPNGEFVRRGPGAS